MCGVIGDNIMMYAFVIGEKRAVYITFELLVPTSSIFAVSELSI